MDGQDFESVIEWVYVADCGRGQFCVVREKLATDNVLFIYLDKHSYYNVFPTMEDYTAYVLGNPCTRICVEEDEYSDLPEGVDVLDMWLYNNIANSATIFKLLVNTTDKDLQAYALTLGYELSVEDCDNVRGESFATETISAAVDDFIRAYEH